MDAYESINKILVHLFNDIWELEEKAVITEEFKDLTNNDMHIIEAIGLGTGNNMSTIAKKLGITVGSLTTSMNSLVNKKYAVRHRSEEDRRIVNIQLTEKGEKASYEKVLQDMKQRDKQDSERAAAPLRFALYELSRPSFFPPNIAPYAKLRYYQQPYRSFFHAQIPFSSCF